MGETKRMQKVNAIPCFRVMEEGDLDGVMEVEAASFSVPWSKTAFQDELNNPLAFYLIALVNEKVIGYAGAWIIFDEAHITNVAVLPAWREMGVGMRMMRAFMEQARLKGARSMTLEVRESNIAARQMYQKIGFTVCGERKNYYDSPKENALIMWLKEL